MDRFGRITFENTEHERVPDEPVNYYYEWRYWLEVEFTEEYLYNGDEFAGVRLLLKVTASRNKSYRRDGKLLSEDLVDDFVEFTMDDPGGHRLYAVSKQLEFYVQENPWLNKLFQMM